MLPTAHLRRLEDDLGFGVAANEALGAVQGASFLLLCHDDVRLAPDAVQVMVEEAYRSNAGVVGPKIVDWHRPERLLQVGMGADRYGQPAPFVERGDLDQSQHDAVRDSFYIPGAATLVRADLFQALRGFDPEITFHGDDLDLGWRARVAGAQGRGRAGGPCRRTSRHSASDDRSTIVAGSRPATAFGWCASPTRSARVCARCRSRSS